MVGLDGIHRQLVAGGTAAIVVRTAEAPLERIKLLLQNQNILQSSKHQRSVISHCLDLLPLNYSCRYTGLVDALIRIPKEQGLAALWRGNATNCVSNTCEIHVFVFITVTTFVGPSISYLRTSFDVHAVLPVHCKYF
jgi:hypothetical protein